MQSSPEERYVIGARSTDVLLADYGSEVAVVITHPWGPLGGDMHNNVVSALALRFQKMEITTLRLNFSGSQIGGGKKEVEEVVHAANFLLDGSHLDHEMNNFSNDGSLIYSSERKTSGHSRAPSGILLVGYSYGAFIAASASAHIAKCIGAVSIAPPFKFQKLLLMFNERHHNMLAHYKNSLPRLLIQGSSDNYTSVKDFECNVQSYSASTTMAVVLENCDHFFRGTEDEVFETISDWLLLRFPSLEGQIENLSKIDLYSVLQLNCPSIIPSVTLEDDGNDTTKRGHLDNAFGHVEHLFHCGSSKNDIQ
mmetsp:Transcript_12646/g.15950  ORF Transcript_12646/g.15950 Transcript_12646/m.15950 type:complete len:309 (+) Transcript_12646:119-1045(+)|eukprot:CAMPEP_0172499268 /NCGR_PEP_ID=MMETSP1066-20121228/124747_1 /TAXON_ID=671091 /ORGANISM="Coscinodiscus wailesii, Strain CCMP2513" /LENGTH=308 /DNA_ID=CAMNT_0013272911 /DNA_START=84 /DNA_END=1010 /DNA_ORIENTATION=-